MMVVHKKFLSFLSFILVLSSLFFYKVNDLYSYYLENRNVSWEYLDGDFSWLSDDFEEREKIKGLIERVYSCDMESGLISILVLFLYIMIISIPVSVVTFYYIGFKVGKNIDL